MIKRIPIFALLSLIFLWACSREELQHPKGEGGELTFGNVSFGESPDTKLSELPNDAIWQINETDKDTYCDVGVYVFYQSDYDAGDYTKPYVKNLRYHINGTTRSLVQADETEEKIYIYDRMVVVAFYPYNEKYKYEDLTDLELYPITESKYDMDQYYIPYRATENVNPTNAYNMSVRFYPKHTVKVDIVIVGTNSEYFNLGADENRKIMPAIDPVEGGQTDVRTKWIDHITEYPNSDGTGKYMRRYTSYIWKNGVDGQDSGDGYSGNNHNHNDNIVHAGDVIFESDNLTLYASQEINLNERNAYRFGYNTATGEIFIPTSSNIVNTAASLAASSNSTSWYQACDIDMSGVTWIPKDVYDYAFDGGGFKISNLKLEKDLTTSIKNVEYWGLFGKTLGSCTFKNIHLDSPVIDIRWKESDDIMVDGIQVPVDSCFIGTLIGYSSQKYLSEEEMEAFLGSMNFPPGTSDVIIAALIEEMFQQIMTSPTKIYGCMTSNPMIEVRGKNLVVGGFVGMNGYSAGDIIEDCCVVGGSLKVNELNDRESENKINGTCTAGGFVGGSRGTIMDSYTTTNSDANTCENSAEPASPENPYPEPVWTVKNLAFGFGKMVINGTGTSGNTTGSYSVQSVAGDNAVPGDALGTVFGNITTTGWTVYTGKWPVYHTYNPFANASYWMTNTVTAGSEYPKLVWDRNH